MKTNITLNEMKRDLAFIEANMGNISIRRMMTLYEKYLNGADSYFLGVELNGMAIALKRKHIPLEWCSCQTDHVKEIQYLRFRPHKKGAIALSLKKGAFIIGMVEEIYKLYQCNTVSKLHFSTSSVLKDGRRITRHQVKAEIFV